MVYGVAATQVICVFWASRPEEILRIPCFVPDALVGWGITNESKKVMGTKPDW
jgi:nitrous oxide reductase